MKNAILPPRKRIAQLPNSKFWEILHSFRFEGKIYHLLQDISPPIVHGGIAIFNGVGSFGVWCTDDTDWNDFEPAYRWLMNELSSQYRIDAAAEIATLVEE